MRLASLDEGETVVHDLIRGDVTFDNTTQVDDFVLVKSDGMPTYNLRWLWMMPPMKITHVIRGEDHLSNTPKADSTLSGPRLPASQVPYIPMILGLTRLFEQAS